MKKQMAATLAAAFVLGVAGTSFAASNPFVDVPAKHWSYDAVTKLAKAGVVDGYGDGTFKGDKTITRYEMAQITAKAMAKSDKANAETKALVDKLAVEYAQELEGLNVRVTKLEKNASSVKITGEARIRYENTDTTKLSPAEQSQKLLALRTRLHVTGAINDSWDYAGRIESTQDMYKSGSEGSADINNVWVHGNLMGVDTTVGRFDYTPAYGMMLDSTLDGVKFSFGNQLKTTLYYGTEDVTFDYNAAGGSVVKNKITATGAEMKYATSKVTNVVGGWYQFDAKDLDSKLKAWELGFDTKLSNDFAFQASYGKTDADTQNKAYYMQLSYKGADKAQVGSFGAWVNYRNLQEYSTLVPTFANATISKSVATVGQATKDYYGGKGYEIGFNYTPAKNVLFTTLYSDIKTTKDGADDKQKFYRAQVEFFF